MTRSDRVRDLRRAGAQAQAAPLRGVHAEGAPRAWSPAIEAARKVLAAQTAAGNDPRASAAVNTARGEAISDGHRRNRSWAREHSDQRDEAWFKREIAPKLDAFPLREMADVTGLSLAACSRIRAGSRVPHPRHWDALHKLAVP
jgi:hypothetical protein